MNMSKISQALLVTTSLAMTLFVGAAQAQAPGVESRSEARKDRESKNVGTARKAEREHQKRMKDAKKAADKYKKSDKSSKAKDEYQKSKERGSW